MDNMVSFVYESSLADLCEVNSSFDKGILKIAYVGRNRNGSSISKSVFEDAIQSMYNCPVVCRYDRGADEIGSHDMEIVNDERGLRLVNSTHPVGVIPSESKWFWREEEDENGVLREYLCAEILLWKREEAYEKIYREGIVKHSMEISVLESHKEDGVYVIDKFEFRAFCLLGTAEPCYEGSELLVCSLDNCREQFAEMMKEFKESFNLVAPTYVVDDISKEKIMTEGGEGVLEDKLALVAEYGVDVDKLGFSLEEFSIDEIREKLEATVASEEAEENFELEAAFREELCKALEAETVETCFGNMPKYCFVDYDKTAMEVYCYDVENDWELVGFSFAMNGDAVVVNYDTKKRKKFAIVDFDEGTTENPMSAVFNKIEAAFSLRDSNWEEKYQNASETIATMENELDALRSFKVDTEKAKEKEAKEEVFARFEDLDGEESFAELQSEMENFSIEEIEEKCYAIRGRKGVPVKFSKEIGSPRLPVMTVESNDEPYGGLFAEYGTNK